MVDSFGKKNRQWKARPGRTASPFILGQDPEESSDEIGYKVYPKLRPSNADIGVSQWRPRYIIVAIATRCLAIARTFDPYAGMESDAAEVPGGEGAAHRSGPSGLVKRSLTWR